MMLELPTREDLKRLMISMGALSTLADVLVNRRRAREARLF
jgi:hypothetical protein